MSQVNTEESTDTSHSVVLSRQVPSPIKEVWRRLVTDEGTNAILGEGAVLGEKGHSWRSADGTHGVVRSYHPLEQIRFSWHAGEDAPSTMVDLHVTAVGDGETLVEIVHDRLGGEVDLTLLQGRWESALSRF